MTRQPNHAAADEANLPLDDQLCFSLYTVGLSINRAYKPMLDEMGITYPQYLVLNVLGERDGMTIGAIADRLSLESSTITPPVKRLEQAGLLTRQRSTLDERQVNVSLIPAGRDMLARSKCLGDALLARSGLDATGFKALNQQIHALIAALGKSPKAET